MDKQTPQQHSEQKDKMVDEQNQNCKTIVNHDQQHQQITVNNPSTNINIHGEHIMSQQQLRQQPPMLSLPIATSIQHGNNGNGDGQNQDDWEDDQDDSGEQEEYNNNGSDDSDDQGDDSYSDLDMDLELADDDDDSDSDDDDDIQNDDDMQQEDKQKYKIPLKQINPESLPPKIQQLYANLTHLKKLNKYFTLPKSIPIQKQVCAKVITFKDTVVQCYDCRMDQTCIICMECFKNGNHQGHKYVVKKAGGGCCDCGDAQAWSEAGFCKNHSGKFRDFDIDQNVVKQFEDIIHGLMYLYFYLKIRKHNSSKTYSALLFDYLQTLNQDNFYYNKLTAMAFMKPLQLPCYKLNQQLDKRTILQNVLTSKISSGLINKFFQVFISMFSYYPFKYAILTHYISNYELIVDGRKISRDAAIAISCQIITSYKLVEQYSKQHNQGLSHDQKLVPTKRKMLYEYCLMLYHDLEAIVELNQVAPFAYFKMLIASEGSGKHHGKGLSTIFCYYNTIIKKIYRNKKQNKKSSVELMTKYVNFSQFQNTLCFVFAKMLRIIQQQPSLIQKVIAYLWNINHKISKLQGNEDYLPIFRPYQRCLILALFKYFNCNLQQILTKKQKLLKQILKIDQPAFLVYSNNLLQRMFRTLFIYAKTQAQSGLGQSLYIYLYFYKGGVRLLSSIDILGIKMFLCLLGSTYQYPLTLQSIIQLSKPVSQSQALSQSYQKQKRIYFQNALNLIKYLHVHQTAQIYVSYTIDPKCNLYRKQITELLYLYFMENKKIVLQSQLKKEFIEGVLYNECQIVNQWIKENCKINKQKKQYVLINEISQGQSKDNVGEEFRGINFDDLWTNIKQKQLYGNYQKFRNLVKNNMQIFDKVWNEVTLKSIAHLMQILYRNTDKDSLSGIQKILSNLINIYLLKLQQKHNKNEIQILASLLSSYGNKIPKQIMVKIKQISQKYYSSNGNDDVNENGENKINFYEMKQSQQNSLTEQQLQKQKIKALKAKKMQKFKQRQQNIIQKHQIQSQPKLISNQQIQQQKNITSNTNSQCCCICKNESGHNFVYLANFSVRNHQKLLGLGVGVQCISMTSCYHAFDYSCILKHYNKKKVLSSIVCPLCKAPANIVISASLELEKKAISEFMERFIQILFSLKESPSICEEVVKIFYHYVLLCLINFRSAYQKRAKLYKPVIQIMCSQIISKDVAELRQKLKNNTLSKNFKHELADQGQKQKNLSNTLLRALFGVEVEEGNIGEIMYVMKKQSIEPQKSHAMKKKSSGEKGENFYLFYGCAEFILNHLEQKINQKQKNQHSMKNQQQQCNPFIKLCFQSLSNRQFDLNRAQTFTNQLKKPEIGKILKQLPQKYSTIGSGNLKKCSQCGDYSVKMILCLHCHWTGCQKCEKGIIKTHINKNHGQVGAAMFIQSSSAYYIVADKNLYTGMLYRDQWENSLQNSTNWELFQLNRGLLEQMENNLVCDQMPSRSLDKPQS